MNYCIHLKKRKNKPYCNIIKKEIPFSRCQECGDKEYKPKSKVNSLYKNKKSTLKGKSPVKSGKRKKKSNKLAKLEKNRFSVFTDDINKCMFCSATTNLTWHEIYCGRNRQNSMEDGLCLRMCMLCHKKKQEDVQFNEFWHREAQLYYEQNIGTREQFLARYRRSYLK